MTFWHEQTSAAEKPGKYSAYGLIVSSEFALPGLLVGSGTPDLHIRKGVIPEFLDAAHFTGDQIQTSRTSVLLRLQKDIGAAFLIRNGNEILIDAGADTESARISLAILGYCMTAVLFQRQLLVLHGSAVKTSSGAIVICGHRRAGKSTTTAALCQNGAELIADDIAAIDTVSLPPRVLPGVPSVKLWNDTLEHLGVPLQRYSAVMPGVDKYTVPYIQRFHSVESALSAVYVLKKTAVTKPVMRHLSGVEKLQAVCAEIRSFAPEQLPLREPWLFRVVSVLVNRVRVVAIERPPSSNTIDELAQLIHNDLRC